jgi:hypothetical protein
VKPTFRQIPKSQDIHEQQFGPDGRILAFRGECELGHRDSGSQPAMAPEIVGRNNIITHPTKILAKTNARNIQASQSNKIQRLPRVKMHKPGRKATE